jgi:hypothetical protein
LVGAVESTMTVTGDELALVPRAPVSVAVRLYVPSANFVVVTMSKTPPVPAFPEPTTVAPL